MTPALADHLSIGPRPAARSGRGRVWAPAARGGAGTASSGGWRSLAGLVVLAILALIAYTTTKQAWPAFQLAGVKFVTGDVWDPVHNEYGALAFIYGTLLTSVIALILAVPVSVGIALFVNESAPRLAAPAGGHVLDLLAAVPSVVYGLWGVLVFAPCGAALLPEHRQRHRRASRC